MLPAGLSLQPSAERLPPHIPRVGGTASVPDGLPGPEHSACGRCMDTMLPAPSRASVHAGRAHVGTRALAYLGLKGGQAWKRGSGQAWAHDFQLHLATFQVSCPGQSTSGWCGRGQATLDSTPPLALALSLVTGSGVTFPVGTRVEG